VRLGSGFTLTLTLTLTLPNPNPNANTKPQPWSGKEGMGALLAHSMGLGKTLTTIALIDALLSSTALRNAARTGGVAGFRCVLVVAPATVLQNWCDEADKWSLP